MEQYHDVLAIGAHPDDVEVFMGSTAAKLVRKGLKLLLVDLLDGEPTAMRTAVSGVAGTARGRTARSGPPDPQLP